MRSIPAVLAACLVVGCARPLIIVNNLEPVYQDNNRLYVVASTPQDYAITFDSKRAIRQMVFDTEGLIPASVTLVDETSAGGKAFMRIVASSTSSFEHSIGYLLPMLGDGTYTWLMRCSGTPPASTQSHGPGVHVRNGSRIHPDLGGSYSLGHFKYGGMDRTRIRRHDGSVTTVVDGDAASPVFLHNEWFYAEFYVSGTTFKGRYWVEGTARPGSALLSARDATYDETEGHPALSVLGNNVLNVDVAEFTFRPAYHARRHAPQHLRPVLRPVAVNEL
jgi:hypothetical protein